MDYEHDYFQNPANANHRPTNAFCLDVSQHGIGTFSRDEVAECISDYHYQTSAARELREIYLHTLRQAPGDLPVDYVRTTYVQPNRK